MIFKCVIPKFATPLIIIGILPVYSQAEESEIRYGRDIRPILSDKCFFCHGPDPETREEGLRLDIREEAIKGKAIVPGYPEKSPLIQLIMTNDKNKIMPPPKSHKKLNEKEKQLLSDWVKAGAEYEPHWAYEPVKKGELNELDEIVENQLEKNGLSLSKPADANTLLRRLHFDIIGLPPTPAEVTAFISAHENDPKQAVKDATDKLLASPHFGERMAVKYLDSVRYADTVGYHGDQSEDVSPYRDYVINSFNNDLNYDQFIIEQIAGDLLPNPTLNQKIASAYNRLGQMSREGGIQDKEYIAKYRAERVRTTSAAFLGSTMACCECHDHKFDPFTAKDFYSFGAYFSDILEKGAYTENGSYQEDVKKYQKDGILIGSFGPVIRIADDEKKAKDAARIQRISELRELNLKSHPESEKAFQTWLADLRKGSKDIKPSYVPIISETLPKQPPINKPRKAADGSKATYADVTADKGPVQSGKKSRVQSSTGSSVQHTINPNKPMTVLEGDMLYAWVYLDPKSPPASVMLKFYTNSWNHRVYWGADNIDLGKNANGGPSYHKAGPLPPLGKWVRLEVKPSDIGILPDNTINQTGYIQDTGTVYWDDAGLVSSDKNTPLGGISAEIRDFINTPNSEKTAEVKNTLYGYYLLNTVATTPEQKELQVLHSELPKTPMKSRTVLVSVSAKPRVTRLLPRGNWTDESGPIVQPAPPEFLTKGKKIGTSRLDLAKWIASPDNPLTARVFVNRIWSQFYGTGLSKSDGDFGFQGEYPSNPELLDWLAAEFVNNDWSIKQLIRTIVNSQTYQQTSTPGGEYIKRDPLNRQLARQTQLRLPAELIRDNALAVSGLLHREVGGASVYPYQPSGYYSNLNFPRRVYPTSLGKDLYRRGIYTHWQRTFVHPMMKNFGAPSREECVTGRSEANTPLQALTLLNDPTFTEAARVLATKLLKESNDKLIDRAMMTCLSRPATEDEAKILNELYQDELKRFEADPEAAVKFISIGKSPKSYGVNGMTAPKLAASTSMIRTIMNLHESITRY